MSNYDSAPDTLAHIAQVHQLIRQLLVNLQDRATVHDRSKLEEPEKSVFDEFTPLLRESTYGSDEYKDFLKSMGEGLTHHYRHNSHHPEYWVFGIESMSLLDIAEMLADWYAATMRHDDGDLLRSIEQNQERFGYSDELKGIFINTAKELGWID